MVEIATGILERYAADAAREVEGVHSVSKVKIDSALKVEIRLSVAWGSSIPVVGREVQERIREYLQGMADVVAASVEVVIDEIA